MPPELLVSIEDDIVGVETQDAIDIVTVTGLGVGDLQLADRPPQLSPTGRPEALAPGNPGGLSLTHPQPPVQPAPCRATPSRAPLQQAAAACWGRRPRRERAAAAGAGGPEASGGSGGGKCLLNFLSVDEVGEGLGAYLGHHLLAVRFHRGLARAQLPRDLLVEPPCHHTRHHVPLPRRERVKPAAQGLALRPPLARVAVAGETPGNCVGPRVVAGRARAKLPGP